MKLAGWALSVVVLVTMAVAGVLLVLVGGIKPAKAVFPGHNGKIVFSAESGEEQEVFPEEIYTINPDGTGRKRLTDNSFFDGLPTFSPDATKIAFISLRNGAGKIFVTNSDGTDARNLSGPGRDDFRPAFSPDGRTIVFENGGDIWVMNAADGSARENLTNTSAFVEEAPVFSPDGMKIAFSRTTAERREIDLYTMNEDGTGVEQLTDFPGREYLPDWSPDGRKLVFTKFSTSRGNRLTRLIVMSADGKSRRTLLEGEFGTPVWSPNGHRVAFGDFDGSRDDISTVKSDGTGKTSVTVTPTVGENFPDWGVKTP